MSLKYTSPRVSKKLSSDRRNSPPIKKFETKTLLSCPDCGLIQTNKENKWCHNCGVTLLGMAEVSIESEVKIPKVDKDLLKASISESELKNLSKVFHPKPTAGMMKPTSFRSSINKPFNELLRSRDPSMSTNTEQYKSYKRNFYSSAFGDKFSDVLESTVGRKLHSLPARVEEQPRQLRPMSGLGDSTFTVNIPREDEEMIEQVSTLSSARVEANIVEQTISATPRLPPLQESQKVIPIKASNPYYQRLDEIVNYLERTSTIAAEELHDIVSQTEDLQSRMRKDHMEHMQLGRDERMNESVESSPSQKPKKFPLKVRWSSSGLADSDLPANNPPKASPKPPSKLTKMDDSAPEKLRNPVSHIRRNFAADIGSDNPMPVPSLITKTFARKGDVFTCLATLIPLRSAEYHKLYTRKRGVNKEWSVSLMEHMPFDLQLTILSYLPSQSTRLNVARTCKTWATAVFHPSLWESVSLQRKAVLDEWLYTIGELKPKHLSFIGCDGDKVSKTGLANLFRKIADRLESFVMTGSVRGGFAGDDLLMLLGSRCINLHSLTVSWTRTSDFGFTAVACSPGIRLRKLELAGCSTISCQLIADVIGRHGQTLTSLDVCHLNTTSPIFDVIKNGFTPLLEDLKIGGEELTISRSEFQQVFRGVPLLKSLTLANNRTLSNDAFFDLLWSAAAESKTPRTRSSSVPSCLLLTSLSCPNTSLTDEALKRLWDNSPSLKHLDLTSCDNVSAVTGLGHLFSSDKPLVSLTADGQRFNVIQDGRPGGNYDFLLKSSMAVKQSLRKLSFLGPKLQSLGNGGCEQKEVFEFIANNFPNLRDADIATKTLNDLKLELNTRANATIFKV